MKNITKYITSLLTASGLLSIIVPLTVTAQNLVVTTNTTVSGTHYENKATGTAALTNSGTWTFTGSDIVLTGTAASGVGRYGANFTGGGQLNLSDSRIDAVYYGIQLTNTSAATLTNTVINSGSVANGNGVTLTTSSTLTMTGGTITTGTTGAIGVNATAGSVDLRGTVINSYGAGVSLSGTSTGTLNSVSITTQSGIGVGLATSSTLAVSGGTITTTLSGNGVNAGTASSVDLQGTVINSYAAGVNLNGTSAANLNNVSITTQNGVGVSLATSSTATVSGGTITTTLGGNGISVATASAIEMRDTVIDSYGVGVALSGTSSGTLNDVSITARSHGMTVATSSTVTFSGGSITGNRGVSTSTGGMASITLRNTTINASASGVFISESSVGILDNVTVTSAANGGAVLVQNSSDLTMTGGGITATSALQGYGIRATNSSTYTLTGVSISTVGRASHGAYVSNASFGTVSDTDITVAGDRTFGLVATVSSTLTVNGGSVTASGTDSSGVMLRNAAGDNPDVPAVDVTLNQVNISVTGSHSSGVQIGDTLYASGTHNLVINGGTISVTEGAGIVSQEITRIFDDYANAEVAENYKVENNITISGGALIRSEQAAVEIGSIYSGTDASGDIVQVDKPITVNISVDGGSQLQGDVKIKDSAVTTLNLTGSSTLTGNLSASGSSALTVTLNNSALTGASAVADNAALNLSLNNNANWNMAGKSKLTTLHGDNGSITIASVQGEDLIVSGNNGVSGITGETKLNLTLSDSVKGDQEIWVVVDETDKMTGERFKLVNEVSYGMYQYELVNASDGAWLVYTGSSGTTPPVNPPPIDPPGPDTPPIISNEGDAIINTAAAVAGFWFTQLDNLHKRMGELRYNKPAGGDLINNVWVRAYGQQINASTGIYSVKGFSEIQCGVDLGTDYLWKLDADNQLYTGIFAGYGGADRDFHTNYSGSTDSGYGGLYATWLNNSGWYADVVAKGQYFRNEFSGADRGDYDSLGVGFSVELGRQFEFKDGWFAEPSVQFSYLHLMNDSYTTRDGMHVDLSDADVLHIYGGARFGRNIKLNNSGQLQPYIKAGGLGQISSGNTLTVSGDHWRPNLDGARAVVGAGVVWQLNADSQLHLDYEASFGEKYDKPWGVNFGYRYQF